MPFCNLYLGPLDDLGRRNPRRTLLRLRVLRPGLPPKIVHVASADAVVGRSTDCDVVIDDPEVSRRHARILHGTVAVDLGARNGTWIDDRRVSEPALVSGGSLRLGRGERSIEIVFEPAEAGAAPAAETAGETASLVSLLAADTLEQGVPIESIELERFLLFVALRLVRAVERLAKPEAGETGLRARLAELLAAPHDAELRRSLDAYLRALPRRLPTAG